MRGNALQRNARDCEQGGLLLLERKTEGKLLLAGRALPQSSPAQAHAQTFDLVEQIED